MLQGRSGEPPKILQNLFDDLMSYYMLSTNIDEEVDAELQSCIGLLTLTYLESITKLSYLSKLVADWVRRSHDILFETKHSYLESPCGSPAKVSPARELNR